MPPFSAAATAVSSNAALPSMRSDPKIATLNVGGHLFQTSHDTLALGGPDSLLSSLASTSTTTPFFIDRDPSLFAVLLSLLRTGRLPSTASSVDPDDLLADAAFYGVDHLLLSALTGPSRFDPFALRRSLLLPLRARHSPSALAATPSGAVLAAHGGKITLFDPSLRRRSTLLTPLPAIDSLLPLPHAPLAAAGAIDFPGLHLLDLRRLTLLDTLTWTSHISVSAAPSTVLAIGASPDLLFGSFESSRRNASAIVAFDLPTSRPVVELGHGEVYGADLDAAIPATKLNWVPGFNLLLAAGAHGGPFGHLGNVRLYDVRSGEAVWEVREKLDCFADVTVSDGLSAIFKVGVNSGDVFMADLRKLSTVAPWTPLAGEGRRTAASPGRREGSGCWIESHGGHVFCSRGGEVEIWSEVAIRGSSAMRREDGLDGNRVLKRNMMGRAEDARRSKITHMAFGGNRVVLARKDEHGVEVWESSTKG